jgi:hypothetical protein
LERFQISYQGEDIRRSILNCVRKLVIEHADVPQVHFKLVLFQE